MKGLNKLVLATAIAAATSSAFAMQALDDDTMSNTTGQDGLTITLKTDVTIGALRIHDKDGLTGSSALGTTYVGTDAGRVNATGFNSYFNSAAGTDSTYTAGGSTAGTKTADLQRSATIVIQGGAAGANGVNAFQGIAIKDASAGANTVLKIDSGSLANGLTPVLHIGVNAGAQTIGLGGTAIKVVGGNGNNYYTANSAGAAGGALVTASSANILSFDTGTTLTTGGATLNIDLGNQPTGHLIWGTSTLNEVGGNLITLGSLNVLQGANGIGITGLKVQAAGVATSITTKLTVDVVAGGLSIGTETVGGTGQDIAIQDIRLGNAYTPAGAIDTTVNTGGRTAGLAGSIGSVYIDNLRTAAQTITISGH